MLDQNPDCAKIESLLDAFHDGELLDEEKTVVGAHLKDCPVCLNRLNEIEKLVSLVGGLPRLRMSQEVSTDWNALWQEQSLQKAQLAPMANSIDSGLAVGQGAGEGSALKPAFRLKTRQRMSMLLAVAAALALLVLTSLLLQMRPLNGPPSVANKASDLQHEIASNRRSAVPANGTSTDRTPNSSSGDLMALYPNESTLASEELGISTDEDGLYALKL